MANRRVEKKSSQTASYTCFSRGCATREKEALFRGPDTLAERLFPPAATLMLNVAPLRKLLLKRMFPPGIHEYVLARTKVMDAAFVQAMEAHFDQIILLGAGFDTRAERFAGYNRGTRIIELDAPPTQTAKLEQFARRKIDIPPLVQFAPIDFDRQSMADVLAQAGFRVGCRNLFLWEGVSMYLTAEAVDATLAFIHDASAPGSRVVFDYIYAAVLRGELRYYGQENAYKMVKDVGEGWTFGLEEGQIGPFLSQRGFTMLAHYSPADLQRLYLTRPDGSLYSRINGTHCIVDAEVKV